MDASAQCARPAGAAAAAAAVHIPARFVLSLPRARRGRRSKQQKRFPPLFRKRFAMGARATADSPTVQSPSVARFAMGPLYKCGGQ